jgi:hypothetical protein
LTYLFNELFDAGPVDRCARLPPARSVGSSFVAATGTELAPRRRQNGLTLFPDHDPAINCAMVRPKPAGPEISPVCSRKVPHKISIVTWS